MKKFHFSLQKLMDYKEQLLESERLILAEMNMILARLQVELGDLLRERRERNDLLIEESARGITSAELTIHKNYLTALDGAIRQKVLQIDLQNEAIDRQTGKVREAKQEVSTIEKLKEKKLEEYNYVALKSEEQFIDEFVNNTSSADAC